MRADSGYYSQALVKICEQREVEFFIVAKQHRNLMNAVREIQDSNWKSFADRTYRQTRGRRRRRRRANLKRKIAIRRKPNSRFKGAPEVAGMMFKPKSWNAPIAAPSFMVKGSVHLTSHWRARSIPMSANDHRKGWSASCRHRNESERTGGLER